MIDWLGIEPWLRAGVFVLGASALLIAEARRPLRPRRSLAAARANIALFVTNTVAVRALSATSLAGISHLAGTNGIGALAFVEAPPLLESIAAIVLLDLGVYLQHRLFHAVPWLWRVHAVHHADPDFDVTTGIRFHPGEIVVSFALKAALVVVLGAPVAATVLFEALLSCASLFTHANLRLPARGERALRRVIVTPDMHRIHHSHARDEQDRNFGFLLSAWDRLFGTQRLQPRGDPVTMPIGLVGRASGDASRFAFLLTMPFVRGAGLRA